MNEPLLETPAAATDPHPDAIAESGAYRELGLSDHEFELAVQALGRRPNWTEASIFGVMWSEHCSYKSSRHLLGTLPTSGSRVLQGPGENAGVVDVGNGQAVVFKVESHNHPSAVEPFHGAATGVGGILRDIFTMGARPVALLNSLRFGPLDGDGDDQAAARTRHLFSGVVEGIAAYGNCVGVPTVGGEVAFDAAYTHNPLVNAMCIGLLHHDELQLAGASGVGNPVMYVGARTGRDGIHGATFASVEDPHERERSAVQVGDPFLEKLLIEACLELLATGAVVGMQDMGAAGLTSSSVEMAARAGSGLELDLDLVPRRESGMRGWELMLSESQERMLVVMQDGQEHVAHEIFERWGLDCVRIGHVSDDGMLRLSEGGSMVAEIPLDPLVEGAPRYERTTREPEYLAATRAFRADALPAIGDADVAEILHRLLAEPTIASKAWVHRQYDSMVGAATVVRPGSDAAVVALRGTEGAIAASMDCNGRWCWLDPRQGAAHAVAEAARNVVCSGAEPIAVTNCLNFSSPEDPQIAWQLEQAVAGMGEACRALDTPVVSGNVSLYNRSGDVDVLPTPVVGMVGLVEHLDHVTRSASVNAGETLLLVGAAASSGRLDGSQFLSTCHALTVGFAPPLDLQLERATQQLTLAAIRAGLVSAAHDVSDGGLLVAIAEMAIPHRLGASIELAQREGRLDELMFGEGASRILLCVRPEAEGSLMDLAREHGVGCLRLGSTGGSRLTMKVGARVLLDEPVESLARSFEQAIPDLMDADRGGPSS